MEKNFVKDNLTIIFCIIFKSAICDSFGTDLKIFFNWRHINPDNILGNVINSASIQPCTQDELLTQSSMEFLKQLPSKDYLNLWSHQARYSMIAPLGNNEGDIFPNNINDNVKGKELDIIMTAYFLKYREISEDDFNFKFDRF